MSRLPRAWADQRHGGSDQGEMTTDWIRTVPGNQDALKASWKVLISLKSESKNKLLGQRKCIHT